MNSSVHFEMFQIEDRYWWFIGRQRLINWLLQEHHLNGKEHLLFDLGCGTGFNLASFSSQCRTIGSDQSEVALDFCRQKGIDNVFRCDAMAVSLANSCVDVVTALDVLEHLADDTKALKEINRVLRPAGKVIITVPAYGFFWSEHDEALHHFRRYVARELRAKLVSTQFEIERSTYFITALFLPILFFRLWQGLWRTTIEGTVSYRLLPSWLNKSLIWVLGLERRLLRFINLPFGVSLVIVARKSARDRDQ